MGRGLVLCSAAFTAVGAARQHVESSSALSVVDEIGKMMRRQHLDQHAEIRKISESIEATPGSDEQYSQSLKSLVAKIEAEVESKIKTAQKVGQAKVDSRVLAIREAKTAADAQKKEADDRNTAWVQCVADEKVAKQAAEDAQASLAAAMGAQAKACKLQQANRGFKWGAAQDAYTLSFNCDNSVDGSCQSGLLGYQKDPLEKMLADAKQAMQANRERYTALKAECDAQTQATADAKAAKAAADKAFAGKELACEAMSVLERHAICGYGKKLQAQCVTEIQYGEFIQATQMKSVEYPNWHPLKYILSPSEDSEADRIDEWDTTAQTKCMLQASVQKGSGTSLASEDVTACENKVDFATQVGRLDNKSAELNKLGASSCKSNQKISFGEGQAWEVAEGAPAAQYHLKPYALTLDHTDGDAPFDVCEKDGLEKVLDKILEKLWPWA